MKQSIRMYYWEGLNFGDSLAPKLVEELSGLPTCWVKPFSTRQLFRKLFSIVFLGRFSRWKDLQKPNRGVLLSIGSILRNSTGTCKIWGSGFMNYSDPVHIHKDNIYALRGNESKLKILKQGIAVNDVPLGDPALLLPLWIKPEINKDIPLGIIPHHREVDYFIRIYGDKYLIIDLRTDDVEKVVGQICSCRKILSTSLHGIIVAHAYGIPALWIKNGDIDTDGFKFKDYFSSVGIEYYDGFGNITELLEYPKSYQELFDIHKEQALIQVSLEQIQRDLLRGAPFHLQQKYQRFINDGVLQ
ncbi:MAG: polysaccharide pyruvyl transferase family protein [Bacteroides sp.]|nr:polysaccharide pyruvyl transferase family protein [Bacteroides sp.]MCM1447753.1 polysaccharide pyruvyl transferase family protein [Bacteroides sp.]